MSEVLTQSRIEDAVASTSSFLNYERGTEIDGDFASHNVSERIISVEERANELLKSNPHPKYDGYFVPLSKYNSEKYNEIVSVMPGYYVLVPSAMVERGTSFFYPAVVSEDGLKSDSLRLHVLKQPYRQEINYGSNVILSAAGQSETKGIGEHGRKSNDGVEAEHFVTLLAAGSDQSVQTAWQTGEHINHKWRENNNTSVLTEANNRLFGEDISQSTITITKSQIENGQAILLWHKGLINEQSGRPETATKENALVIVQSLGFEALKNTNPSGIDVVKKLIA